MPSISFVQEARLALRLSHPHVVHALELVRDEQGYALVSEWIDGCSLAELFERLGPLPWQALLFVGRSMAQALAYIHGLEREDGAPAGIVHRDVTPANILATTSGEVKLSDFGVAWCAGERASSLVAGAGTSGFAAPEQLARGAIDCRADLFGLGATLRALGDQLPSSLARVVERATSPAPQDRYASARELESAVVESAREEKITSEPRLLADWIAAAGGLPARRPPPSLDGAVQSILGLQSAEPACCTPAPRRRRRPQLPALGLGVLLAGGAALFALRTPPAMTPGSDALAALPAPPAASPAVSTPNAAPLAPRPEPPAPAKAPPAQPSYGLVNLNASPWAAVTIDGTPFGNTPLRGVRLAAGPHAVTLVHPPQSLTREVTLEVVALKAQTFVIDLRRETITRRIEAVP